MPGWHHFRIWPFSQPFLTFIKYPAEHLPTPAAAGLLESVLRVAFIVTCQEGLVGLIWGGWKQPAGKNGIWWPIAFYYLYIYIYILSYLLIYMFIYISTYIYICIGSIYGTCYYQYIYIGKISMLVSISLLMFFLGWYGKVPPRVEVIKHDKGWAIPELHGHSPPCLIVKRGRKKGGAP